MIFCFCKTGQVNLLRKTVEILWISKLFFPSFLIPMKIYYALFFAETTDIDKTMPRNSMHSYVVSYILAEDMVLARPWCSLECPTGKKERALKGPKGKKGKGPGKPER